MLDAGMSSDITSSVKAFSHNSLNKDALDIVSCSEEMSRGGAGKVNIIGWGCETRQTRGHITLQSPTHVFRMTVSLFSWWNTLCLPSRHMTKRYFEKVASNSHLLHLLVLTHFTIPLLCSAHRQRGKPPPYFTSEGLANHNSQTWSLRGFFTAAGSNMETSKWGVWSIKLPPHYQNLCHPLFSQLAAIPSL